LIQSSEPFLKGVSLHNPALCEKGSPMFTQVVLETDRHVKNGGKVYGEVLGPLRGGSNARTVWNPKGDQKADGPERRMWCRVKMGFRSPNLEHAKLTHADDSREAD
jgi:hypothetical protein